jgi:hypothetical protein
MRLCLAVLARTTALIPIRCQSCGDWKSRLKAEGEEAGARREGLDFVRGMRIWERKRIRTRRGRLMRRERRTRRRKWSRKGQLVLPRMTRWFACSSYCLEWGEGLCSQEGCRSAFGLEEHMRRELTAWSAYETSDMTWHRAALSEHGRRWGERYRQVEEPNRMKMRRRRRRRYRQTMKGEGEKLEKVGAVGVGEMA